MIALFNQVRLRLFALAYNLANFLRQLALPRSVRTWTLTTLREKLIKSGPRSSATPGPSRSSWRRGRAPGVVRGDPEANRSAASGAEPRMRVSYGRGTGWSAVK